MIDYLEAGRRILDAREQRLKPEIASDYEAMRSITLKALEENCVRKKPTMQTPKSKVFENYSISTRPPEEDGPEPVDSLNSQVHRLADGLHSLNLALADANHRLFGDPLQDEKPQPPQPLNGPIASVQAYVEEAQCLLRIAHERVRNILNRI